MGEWSKRGGAAAVAAAAAVLTVGGAAAAGAATPAPTASHTWVAPSWCTPTVSGAVTSVGAGSFVLTEPDGTVVTVATTATTSFTETGAGIQPTGVATGQQVTVTTVPGTSRHATSVTATAVLIVLTHVIGTVQSVGTGSFTLQLVGGLVVTVGTGPATVVRRAGMVQPGVTVGEYVTAYGAPDSADPSRLDARYVVIADPPAPAPSPGAAAQLTGAVSAAGTGGFTLTVADGTVVTVTTTPSTTYGETGSPTAPAGVADGQQVRVTPVDGTTPGATSVTAARVVVVLTQVTGTVTSVGAGSFTVQLAGGLVLTVETTPSTVVVVDGATATTVTVGQKVTAYGTPDPAAPSQLVAGYVQAHAPVGPGQGGHGDGAGGDGEGTRGNGGHSGPPGATDDATTPPGDPARATAWGTVASVSGTGLVVSEPSGTAVTVVVSASTRYVGTDAGGGLAGVTVGAAVGVAGTAGPSGAIDALVVLVGGTPAPGDGAGHRDGSAGGRGGPPSSTTGTTDATPSGNSGGAPWSGGSGPGQGATTTSTPAAPAPTVSAGPGGPGGHAPSGGWASGGGPGQGQGQGSGQGQGPGPGPGGHRG